MKANIVRVVACVFSLMLFATLPAQPQTPSASQASSQDAAATPAQLDQLVAPIALYPDPLLAQILMASTYPLEVVEADRWLQDPSNAALKDIRLTAVLDQQTWDPSVKSLVPFPQVLQTMDDNLQWTEQLGNAFLADQDAVMDAVERLRQQAQTAGHLQTTPQEIVTTEDQDISIAPTSPDIVYVPCYDPTVIYGVWPYLDYPPYYFAPSGCSYGVGLIGFGYGYPILPFYWGWHHWHHHHHGLEIDRDRWHAMNPNRPSQQSTAWQHDPDHRHGVAYGDAKTQARFQGAGARSPAANRDFRGYGTGTGTGTTAPAGRTTPQAPANIARPPAEPTIQRPSAPAFESFSRGYDVRSQSQRGFSSRSSPAPTFGGGHIGGGGGGGGGGGHVGGGGSFGGGMQRR